MRNNQMGFNIDGDRAERNGACRPAPVNDMPQPCCQGRCAAPCENGQGCSRGAPAGEGNRSCTGCQGRTPGMVYAQEQRFDNLYAPQRALQRGTLFGCLDKPMCGEPCAEQACTTPCQQAQFTLWELRLYLDTHPCDQQARAAYWELLQQLSGGDGCCDKSRWAWTDGPWPWEYRPCGREA